ncbi:MAG: hypothetical protein IJY57_05280 [Clostridia bacterium]|nr:hypothetical protein [Clostridia bacterium]
MAELKSFKEYCKEAKRRLKSGFWQNYQKEVENELIRAEKQGISKSKVKEYYTEKVREDILQTENKSDDFYLKVKNLLDTEGEVGDALGRLTDKEKYEKLSYEEKQRYSLELSERYLKAVERYKKEKALNVN